MANLDRATDFIWRNARLIDRALYAHAILDGPAEHVLAVVRAYQNPDGGFGHALEGDIRGPVSQPIHVEVALEALVSASVSDEALVNAAAGFIASVATPGGPVPGALASVSDFPHAPWWAPGDEDAETPNPTASIAGYLHALTATHEWLERATEWCWTRLERPIEEAHAIRTALIFLEHVPDRERAQSIAPALAASASGASYFVAEPGGDAYGLTPLHLAPTPDSVGAPAFEPRVIDAHLDALEAAQQDDGGWPITFTAQSPGSAIEWRGRWTLEAARTLRAYGRL